jgi:hypothetical protein
MIRYELVYCLGFAMTATACSATLESNAGIVDLELLTVLKPLNYYWHNCKVGGANSTELIVEGARPTSPKARLPETQTPCDLCWLS